MNVWQPLSLLACDFASPNTVAYTEPKRIKPGAATVLTGQPSRFLTFVSESSFPSLLQSSLTPQKTCSTLYWQDRQGRCSVDLSQVTWSLLCFLWAGTLTLVCYILVRSNVFLIFKLRVSLGYVEEVKSIDTTLESACT